MKKTLPRTHSCFVCGDANPLGLNLEFETDGREVFARYRPRPEHVGFKQTIHGGLLATVLDEAMVWVCGVCTGQFAYCAEMTVRFRRPVPPGTELLLVGRLQENRRGRLFLAEASLRDDAGREYAASTGKYMPIEAGVVEDMLEDFVGEIRNLLRSPSKPDGRAV